jgi:hypothetical protein
MVQEIKGFRNEVEPALPTVRDVLHDSEIQIDKTRRLKRVPAETERR